MDFRQRNAIVKEECGNNKGEVFHTFDHDCGEFGRPLYKPQMTILQKVGDLR